MGVQSTVDFCLLYLQVYRHVLTDSWPAYFACYTLNCIRIQFLRKPFQFLSTSLWLGAHYLHIGNDAMRAGHDGGFVVLLRQKDECSVWRHTPDSKFKVVPPKRDVHVGWLTTDE